MKTCDNCRALNSRKSVECKEIIFYPVCDLGFSIGIHKEKPTILTNHATPVPLEKCPKPLTWDHYDSLKDDYI